MRNILIKARTCFYNINYHVVWTTNNRKEVLNSKIEDRVKEILLKIAEDKDFLINKIDIRECSQIDLFISAHPKISISYMVKMMKGISGRIIMKEFPEIDNELWNPSYYVETIGNISNDDIKNYIKCQERGDN